MESTVRRQAGEQVFGAFSRCGWDSSTAQVWALALAVRGSNRREGRALLCGNGGPSPAKPARLGASLAVSGSWDTPCPWPGRAPSRSGADTLPPGPVPTPCWAVSSPPSKSVTHSASHIPQLQEIQNASVPAFLQPHMPPPCLSLKYFSCSRASLLLAFFSPRGKKTTLLSLLSALRNPH